MHDSTQSRDLSRTVLPSITSIKCDARIYDLQRRRPVSDGDDVPDGIPLGEVQAALRHVGRISPRGGEHRAGRYTRIHAIAR